MVTGAAGFIGYHVSRRLLDGGATVVGVDNVNDYYDVRLKEARLARLQGERFTFHRTDIADAPAMEALFGAVRPARVVHLAAQPGVRYSLTHPYAYTESNIRGFLSILEGCRHHGVEHLVFASTSSVYGANRKQPFQERDHTDHPVSLYAATKKANEMMAHTYAALFGIPVTGLRFFTVYGPWGRPDMAPMKFTRGIFADEPIPVFNRGQMIRDFTFIDDIVEGVVRILDRPATPNPEWDGQSPSPESSFAPYRIYNIGNNQPVELMRFISVLEEKIGRKARLEMLPMQPGDVTSTMADVSALERATGFRPATSIEVGVERMVEWYRAYYGI